MAFWACDPASAPQPGPSATPRAQPSNELSTSLGDSNCFLFGYSYLAKSERGEDRSSMVRMRFNAQDDADCKDLLMKYCKSEILAGAARTDLKGRFKRLKREINYRLSPDCASVIAERSAERAN